MIQFYTNTKLHKVNVFEIKCVYFQATNRDFGNSQVLNVNNS